MGVEIYIFPPGALPPELDFEDKQPGDVTIAPSCDSLSNALYEFIEGDEGDPQIDQSLTYNAGAVEKPDAPAGWEHSWFPRRKVARTIIDLAENGNLDAEKTKKRFPSYVPSSVTDMIDQTWLRQALVVSALELKISKRRCGELLASNNLLLPDETAENNICVRPRDFNKDSF